MAEQTITAIYHEGVFHPTAPEEITLPEGQKVKLSIEQLPNETDTERLARIGRIMDLLEHFYDGVDEAEIAEIEQTIRQRVNFAGPENKAQFD